MFPFPLSEGTLATLRKEVSEAIRKGIESVNFPRTFFTKASFGTDLAIVGNQISGTIVAFQPAGTRHLTRTIASTKTLRRTVAYWEGCFYAPAGTLWTDMSIPLEGTLGQCGIFDLVPSIRQSGRELIEPQEAGGGFYFPITIGSCAKNLTFPLIDAVNGGSQLWGYFWLPIFRPVFPLQSVEASFLQPLAGGLNNDIRMRSQIFFFNHP